MERGGADLAAHTALVALQQELQLSKAECQRLQSEQHRREADCRALRDASEAQSRQIAEQLRVIEQLMSERGASNSSSGGSGSGNGGAQAGAGSSSGAELEGENASLRAGLRKQGETIAKLIELNNELVEFKNRAAVLSTPAGKGGGHGGGEEGAEIDLHNLPRVPLEASVLSIPRKPRVSSSHSLAESYGAGDQSLLSALATFMTEKDSDLPMSVFDLKE